METFEELNRVDVRGKVSPSLPHSSIDILKATPSYEYSRATFGVADPPSHRDAAFLPQIVLFNQQCDWEANPIGCYGKTGK
jgi:hypothetical protein